MLYPTNNTPRSESLSFTTTCVPFTQRRLNSAIRLGSTLSYGLVVSSLSRSSRANKTRIRGTSRVASSSSFKFGSPERRVTDSLIVLNVVIFGIQSLTGSLLVAYGAKINSLIVKGQLWRFVTSAFLHGDILHLVFNCNALHNIGPLVEQVSGHARFATIYLGSAVAGSVLSFIMSPHVSLGASGAIFGIASALAMFAWRHKKLMGPAADELLIRLRDTAAINFMYGLIVRRIDNWGHLGGLIGGAVLSYILGPSLKLVMRNKKAVRIEDRPLLPILASRGSHSQVR